MSAEKSPWENVSFYNSNLKEPTWTEVTPIIKKARAKLAPGPRVAEKTAEHHQSNLEEGDNTIMLAASRRLLRPKGGGLKRAEPV